MRVAPSAAALVVLLSIAGCGARVSLGYDDDLSGDAGATPSVIDADIDAPFPPDADAEDAEADAAPDEDVIEEFEPDVIADASID